jgi:hypothetical protein
LLLGDAWTCLPARSLLLVSIKISFNFFLPLETFDVLLLQADSPGADFIRFLLKPKQLLKPLVTAIYDESFPHAHKLVKALPFL